MQFSLLDTSELSATPQELLQKLSVFTAVGPDDESDDDDDTALTPMDSLDLEDEDDDDADEKEEDTSDETDGLSKTEKAEKQKKKLRLRRLKRKTKARAYNFSGGIDVVGIIFLEINRINDLPPERNSEYMSPQRRVQGLQAM